MEYSYETYLFFSQVNGLGLLPEAIAATTKAMP
jgi:hypothetical protein